MSINPFVIDIASFFSIIDNDNLYQLQKIIRKGVQQVMRNSSFTLMLSLMLALVLIVVAGCSSNSGSNAGSTPAPSASPSGESASPSPSESAPASSASASGTKTVYPLSIENYTMKSEGGTWEKKTQTFNKAPERVVANTQPIAELLIKLGLTDKLVGVAALYGELDPEVAGEFAKVPVLSKDYVSKEPVVGTNPDLVMGRGDLFADADWGVGTVDGLNELGIATFVHSTSVKGATLNSLYQDIEQIGQIFDVQDKAAEHIKKLQERGEALKSRFAGASSQTFAFVSDIGDGGITAYSGYNDTFQGEALGLLNLHNAFGDIEATTVSAEELIAGNPDIMLLSYYAGAPDPEKTLKELYENAALKDVSAVKNKKVFIIDFNAYWGYGDQIFNAIEKLADEITAKS